MSSESSASEMAVVGLRCLLMRCPSANPICISLDEYELSLTSYLEVQRQMFFVARDVLVNDVNVKVDHFAYPALDRCQQAIVDGFEGVID